MMLTLSVLSCRRPDALHITLKSFFQHVRENEPSFPLMFVCVDNSASSETTKLLKSFGPAVHVALDCNTGQGPAMNIILRHLTTPYLLHLEDDWVLENTGAIRFLDQSVQIMEENPSLGQLKLAKPAVGTDYSWNDLRSYRPIGQAPGGYTIYEQNPELEMSGFNFPPAVTRVAMLRSVGLFTEHLPYCHGYAEYDYAQRTKCFGCRSARVRELTLFRHQDGPPCDGWS